MRIVACIQTNSSDIVDENLARIAPLAEQSVAQGAVLLSLPENAFAMRREGERAESYVATQHPGVLWAQGFCRTHRVTLHIGSIRATVAGQDKPANRGMLIGPEGDILAQYDKIHLFDVTLPDGTAYQESDFAIAGSEMVVAHTGVGMVGMSICYDLRFPELYAGLVARGAQMLLVPAAFTRPTGRAHWEVLLRARAIETQSYVIASAQCGTHPGGRETYGHSMIVSPWGEVLAEAGDAPGVICAGIDLDQVRDLRAGFPLRRAGA